MNTKFKTQASRSIPVNFYHGYFVDDRKLITEPVINRKPFFSGLSRSKGGSL